MKTKKDLGFKDYIINQIDLNLVTLKYNNGFINKIVKNKMIDLTYIFC